jgi:hypothetical protein
MKNILIPTDFSPSSLRLVEAALKTEGYNRCNVILFHAFDLPSNPFDMLRNGAKDPAATLLTEEFRLACKQLKDEYGRQVGKIVIKTMQGSTRSLFRHFLDANDIDLIFCPDTYLYSKVHERSLDPLPFFGKCGVPVIRKSAAKKEWFYSNPLFNPLQASAQ